MFLSSLWKGTAMMNAFDFYFVDVSSGSKKALVNAGIDPSRISTSKEIVRYGRKSFPRFTYHAAVAHSSVSDEGRKFVDSVASEWAKKGLVSRVKYHVSD